MASTRRPARSYDGASGTARAGAGPARGARALGCFLLAWLAAGPSLDAAADPRAAEGPGRPILHNYTYKDSGAESQHWDVVQGDGGIVYFANNAGVVEFDGSTWRIIELPARVPVRSLATGALAGGRIYAGSPDELGYLGPGDDGQLRFTSILPADEERDRRFKALSRPVVTPSGVYFHLKNSLCRWSAGQLRCSEVGAALTGIFGVEGRVYVHQAGVGLMQAVDTALVPVSGGERFAAEDVAVVLPYPDAGDRRLLVGTRRLGLFVLREGRAQPIGPGLSARADEDQLVTGAVLPDGAIALGTRQRGVLVMDRHGVIRQQIDRASGLQDNHVHGIWPDRQGGLWLALQHGVSRVEFRSPYSVFDEASGLEREWREVARHDGDLYVRGYKGLFVSRADGPRTADQWQPTGPAAPRFSRVEEIEPPVWAFVDLGHALLVTGRDGVFAVHRGRVRRIASYGATPTSLLRSRREPDRVYVGLADGLASVRFAAGRWMDEGRVDGVDETITSMAEAAGGELWVVARSYRVMRIVVEAAPARVHGQAVARRQAVVRRFGADAMTGRISARTLAGRPVFLAETGILEFDSRAESFVQVPALAALPAAGRRAFSWIAEDPHGNVWVASRKPGGVDFLWKQADGTYVVDDARLRQVTAWSIFPDPQRNLVWFSTPDYLLRYDPAAWGGTPAPFDALLRRVSVNDGEVVLAGAGEDGGTSLPASARSLRFEFAAARYDDPQRNDFRARLEGFDTGWSAWGRDTVRSYTNLRPGRYRFRLQARDVLGQVGGEASFAFTILPPWYQSTAALAAYVLLGVVGLFAAWRVARRAAWLRLERERQRLELDKLREIDRLKSRFFADVSHEFRTPLTLIVGPVAQMLEETGSEESREKLGLVRRHADYLLRLIEQLLDLSKLEAGRMRLHPSPGDLLQQLAAIVGPFGAVASAKGVRVQLEVPAGSLRACFDADVLQKILNNLLGNALRYTQDGGAITVRFRHLRSVPAVDPGAEDAELVEIAVSDTGAGIAPECVPHVFERFYQGQGSASREGFGIGLALVKELAELHGGGVDVESEVGRGTTFRVRFSVTEAEDAPVESAGPATVEPAAAPPAEPVAIHLADHDGLPPPDDRASVLVVEDHADLRGFLREQLQGRYRVFEACSGSEGLDRATALLPGLVLSDVMMDGMDGLELCETLKRDTRTCHIPVVLLTARGSREDRLRGLRFGADGYLVKPFDPPELIAQLDNLLEQRRVLRQRFSGAVVLKPSEMAVVPADQAFLTRVLTAIEENLENAAFDVEDLGRAVGLSRSQLHRRLRALTNKPPTLLIRSIRLQRAASMLSGQAGSVSEVAYRVGFNSQAYFAKCFREEFGVSPREHQRLKPPHEPDGNGHGAH